MGTGPLMQQVANWLEKLGIVNVELSLPIFRLALAVFIPWRGADGFDRRADGTRADGVLDRGRRRIFSFLRFGAAAPSSYRADRGRHLASSSFGGVAQLTCLAALSRTREGRWR